MKNTFIVFLLSLAIIINFCGCDDDSGTQPNKKHNYANQILVFSFHTATVYLGEIYISDPDTNFTSITVTGSGITGIMHLVYKSDNAWWHSSNPQLGSLLPTTPQTFNFVITDKSGDTTCYSKTITGYVEAFATNLSPTGSVKGTVNFSWTGITNADQYDVELYLNSNYSNRIWQSIPSNTTSATYNGNTILTPGQTYYYLANSAIVTDGVANWSSTNGTFTYTGP
jgi:hypothetical protein